MTQPETVEERLAREDAEWRARKVAAATDTRRLQVRDRLARIDERLRVSVLPLLEPMELQWTEDDALRADYAARLALPVGREERRAIERSLSDVMDRLGQMANGWSASGPGDLAERLQRRGAKIDGRSLVFLRQEAAALREERRRLQAELDAM